MLMDRKALGGGGGGTKASFKSGMMRVVLLYKIIKWCTIFRNQSSKLYLSLKIFRIICN